MLALTEIPGIGKSSVALLDAAGIRDAGHLAAQKPDSLLNELISANDVLEIVKRVPNKNTVEKWISTADELINSEPKAHTATATVQIAPVNHEANAEVAEMLGRAPFAIPMPGRMMMEKELRVSDVPAGILLNRYSGDLDVRIGNASESAVPSMPVQRQSANIERIENKPEFRQPEAPRTHRNPSAEKPAIPTVKPIAVTETTASVRIPTSKNGHEEDRVALIRAPREKTNRGKDPNSRRYIRGVLHTHPWSLRIGATFSILLLANLPLAIISAFLLLFSQEQPESFHWVPEWILAFPIALPIIGIGYLIWGFSGKCRICTQKLFVHKGALKHVKAHRLPGLGYVVPLCLHLLVFQWFRCSSCGTPVRLKK